MAFRCRTLCDRLTSIPPSAVDDQQQLIWSTPLAGVAFTKDNRAVYQIMKSLMLDTEGWAWFQDAAESDGRAAFLLFQAHYDGMAEMNRRAVEAEARIKELHYKNEAVFPHHTILLEGGPHSPTSHADSKPCSTAATSSRQSACPGITSSHS